MTGQRLAFLASVAALALAAGCSSSPEYASTTGGGFAGGDVGGGGGGPAPPTDDLFDRVPADPGYLPGVTPDDLETTEYRTSSVSLTGASEAWARGATGVGSRVGVIDSGVEDGAGAVYGARLEYDSAYAGGIYDGLDTDANSHGSRVASIVGAGSGSGMVGIAPGATIVAYAAPGADPGTVSLTLAAEAVRRAAANGVEVVNMSFGGENLAGEAFDLSDDFTDAVVDAARDGMVFVVAAGNEGQDEVTMDAALPLYAQAYIDASGSADRTNPLVKRWFAVAALNAQGSNIAAFSNRCGMAKNFCLAAPGENVATIDKTGAVSPASGTSFAAPQVAGAFAVLRDMWPTLDERDIVEIILRTADDLGLSGVDEVFGYGRLNLGRAVAPVGQLVLPPPATGPDLDFDGDILATSTLVASAPLSAALRRLAVGGDSLAVVDAYGRGFGISMSAFAREARKRIDWDDEMSDFIARRDVAMEVAPGVTLRLAADPENRLDYGAPAIRFAEGALSVSLSNEGRPSDIPGVASFAAQTAPSGYIDPRRIENPYLALMETVTGAGAEHALGDGWRAGAFAASGETETGRDAAAYGLTVAKDFADGARLAATLGVVEEDGAMLGASGAGLFGFGDSETGFVSLAGRAPLGENFALVADAHAGFTRLGSGAALVREGEAVSTAWTLGVERAGVFGEKDRLGLSVGQPLSVESGALSYRLSTPDGLEGRSADLDGAREIDLRLGWAGALSEAETLAVGGLMRFDADGAAGRTDAGLAFRYTRRF